jgi:hypothetical protein
MTKILVMGNSHCATIKTGANNISDSDILKGFELYYLIVGNVNGGLKDVQITDQSLNFSLVAQSTKGFRSLSLPSLDLNFYDKFLVAEGLNPLDLRNYSRIDSDKKFLPLSRALITSICLNINRYSNCVTYIAQKFPQKTIIASAPPPAFVGDNQELLKASYGAKHLTALYKHIDHNIDLLKDFSEKIREACEHSCRDSTSPSFILPPKSLLDDSCLFLKSDYASKDLFHGDEHYGEAMLEQIALLINSETL